MKEASDEFVWGLPSCNLIWEVKFSCEPQGHLGLSLQTFPSALMTFSWGLRGPASIAHPHPRTPFWRLVVQLRIFICHAGDQKHFRLWSILENFRIFA